MQVRALLNKWQLLCISGLFKVGLETNQISSSYPLYCLQASRLNASVLHQSWRVRVSHITHGFTPCVLWGFWWYLERVFMERTVDFADTWPLGTSLIFHDSHQSVVNVTYHSPTIGEKGKLAPLWNLFRSQPDFMVVFCFIHGGLDILMVTALLFCVVAVYYSREFRKQHHQKREQTGNRVTRSSLIGV